MDILIIELYKYIGYIDKHFYINIDKTKIIQNLNKYLNLFKKNYIKMNIPITKLFKTYFVIF